MYTCNNAVWSNTEGLTLLLKTDRRESEEVNLFSFQKKHKIRTKWPEFADLILKREKYILEWIVEWIQDQEIWPSKLAVIDLHFLCPLFGNWNLLVLSRAMSFSLVVWLKSSWRNISVTWNFLENDFVNSSWDIYI